MHEKMHKGNFCFMMSGLHVATANHFQGNKKSFEFMERLSFYVL